MTDELKPACGSCEFYFETEADQNLQRQTVCRRYPPHGQLVPMSNGVAQMAFFPAVQSHHWCGEYKQSTKIVLQ